ncbi:hypothetical protein P691DRAFT_669258, partial [Macrolepiota fuliginosa MF-IS2]
LNCAMRLEVNKMRHPLNRRGLCSGITHDLKYSRVKLNRGLLIVPSETKKEIVRIFNVP